jgi:hypothetical protein
MSELIISCDSIDREAIPPLSSAKPVQIVADCLLTKPKEGYLNIFCSGEPPAIVPQVYAALANPAWCSQWDAIIAAHLSNIARPDLVKVLNMNANFWVDPHDDQEPPKTFGISTIMSWKRYAEGHQLRHWLRENWTTTVPSAIFHGQEPPSGVLRPYPEDRRECFRNMFHLVIENCRYPGYFTEKLMDCLRCKCVPIYWGAPNIGEYFDINGIITVGHLTKEEIMKVLETLTPDDYYNRRTVVEENAKKAEELCEGINPFPFDKSLPKNQYRGLAKIINSLLA